MSARPIKPIPWRTRWSVLGRVLAASVGGYVVTALSMAALAAVLPWISPASPATSVLIATLLSFAVYTGLAVWAFSSRSATRAWVGLALLALPCATGLLLIRHLT